MLLHLRSMNNIDNPYHNFTTFGSSSINNQVKRETKEPTPGTKMREEKIKKVLMTL